MEIIESENIHNDNMNKLVLEMNKCDTSFVNSIRRTILTNIKTLVFRGFPHNENKIKFIKNVTNYHNEYLKQRLSCIPIHYNEIDDFNTIIKDYYVLLKVENSGQEKKLVTTDDFKIIKKSTQKETTFSKHNLFPKDPKTKDPIVICYLNPQVSQNDPVQEIEAHLEFSVGTAKEDSCWNVVSKCLFYNSPDEQKIETYKETIDEEKKRDFEILDSQRHFLKDHFVFRIETLGIYSNKDIIIMASNHLVDYFKQIKIETKKINNFRRSYNQSVYYENMINIFKDDKKTHNVFILRLENEDYTVGKLIEKYLFNHRVENDESNMNYVTFNKTHPHNDYSYVNIIYNEEENEDKIILEDLLFIYDKIIYDFQYLIKVMS